MRKACVFGEFVPMIMWCRNKLWFHPNTISFSCKSHWNDSSAPSTDVVVTIEWIWNGLARGNNSSFRPFFLCALFFIIVLDKKKFWHTTSVVFMLEFHWWSKKKASLCCTQKTPYHMHAHFVCVFILSTWNVVMQIGELVAHSERTANRIKKWPF